MFPPISHIYVYKSDWGKLKMDILFLIISLLILCLITGLRMLIHIWGKKYRYNTAWHLVEVEKKREKIRKRRRYEQ